MRTPSASLRGHHSTNERPVSRGLGHVSSSSLAHASSMEMGSRVGDVADGSAACAISVPPVDVWPLRVPLTGMRPYALRCHGSRRHARGCSAATELPSGVPRHGPIPASRQWAWRGRGPEARALRASAEIPTSRTEGLGPLPLPRQRRCSAATAHCSQDVSHSRTCSCVPSRGQALVSPGHSHRRQSSQPPTPAAGRAARRAPALLKASSSTLRGRTGGCHSGSLTRVTCQ